MNSLKLYFYIILQLWVIVNCEEDHTENEEHIDFLDPYSFDYDRGSKKMVGEIQYSRSDGTCVADGQCRNELQRCRDTLNHNKFERIYIARLLTLLLSTANLQENEDILSGSIDLYGSKSEIEKLRGFGDGKINVREVDAILSNIIRPTSNVLADTFSFIDGLFRAIHEYGKIITAFCIAVVILLSIKYVNWSTGKVIVVFLALVFLVSFFMIWSQLIKEAELKQIITLKKNKEIPIQCEPEKMNFWDRIVTHFNADDECLEYYKAIDFNPFHVVSPLDVLPVIVDKMMLRLLSPFGAGVSGFIDNATKRLIFPMNWIITILLYCGLIIFVVVVLVVLPFCAFGGALGLQLGPFFKIYFRGGRANHEQDHPIQPPMIETREPVIDLPPMIAEHNSRSELNQLPSTTVTPSIKDDGLAVGAGDSETQAQKEKPENSGAVCGSCCCKNTLNKSHVAEDEVLVNSRVKEKVPNEEKGDGDR